MDPSVKYVTGRRTVDVWPKVNIIIASYNFL